MVMSRTPSLRSWCSEGFIVCRGNQDLLCTFRDGTLEKRGKEASSRMDLLPPELLESLLSWLPLADLATCSRVCALWAQVARTPP